MRKLILIPLFLLLGLVFLVPTPAQAACNEGEWSFEMETKGESWLGDYGACSGGRYRCHSVCWDRWTTQCVGGVWVRKWVASSGCSKDHVCRAQTGWSGRHCDCCTPPSHNVCQGKACVKVFTSGADECSAPALNSPDCVHKACNDKNMLCEEVPGKGPNLCTVNEDCFHKECQGCACAKAPGKGPGAKPCTIVSPSSPECCAPPTGECRCQCVNTCCVGETNCTGPGDCLVGQRFKEWRCNKTSPTATCPPRDVQACPVCFDDPTCKQNQPTVATWFQTAQGDVVAAGGLSVDIPKASDVLPFSSDFDKPLYKGPYFSVGSPVGVVFVGQGSASFGNGSVSAGREITGHDPWLARDYSPQLGIYNFDHFNTNNRDQVPVDGSATLSNGVIRGSTKSVSLPGLEKGKVVHVERDLTVEDGNNLEGAAAMILVGGTLTFNRDFSPQDSAIFFVSLGAVSFGPEVKSVRAAVLTDGGITLFGVSNNAPQPEYGLLLEGMYLANGESGDFSIDRQRKNNNASAVMFSYAPEIIVELTKSYGKARVTGWREVIGGKK